MPLDRLAINDVTWEYAFPRPELDLQNDFRTNIPGKLSRLVGVDGRYTGRLRRFPGFFEKYSIPTSYTLPLINGEKQVFEHFAIQQGPGSSQIIRGVVFLVRTGGTVDSLRVFASINGAAPVDALLVDFGALVNYVDVAIDHQFLYIVGESNDSAKTKIEKLARYCGSTAGWKVDDWDTAVPSVSTSGYTATAHGTSFLQGGSLYGVTARVIYPDQGLVGPIAVPQVKAFSSGTPGYALAFLSETFKLGSLPGNVATRAVIQVFRTPSNIQPLNSGVDFKNIGSLFLESEYEVPRYSKLASLTLNPSSSSVNGKLKWIATGTANIFACVYHDATADGKNPGFLQPDNLKEGSTTLTHATPVQSLTAGQWHYGQWTAALGGRPAGYGSSEKFIFVRTLGSVDPDSLAGVTNITAEGIPIGSFQPNQAPDFVEGSNMTLTGSMVGCGVDHWIDAGALAGGDVIYLLYGLDCVTRLKGMVFRRTIGSVGAASFSVLTSTAFPFPAVDPAVAGNIGWCLSRVKEEADTSGTFFLTSGLGINQGFLASYRLGCNDLPLTTDAQNPNYPTDGPRGLSDNALTIQDSLDPVEFGVLAKGNPRARLVEVYEDLYVTVSSPSVLDGALEQDVIRWSSVDTPRKGLYPILNRRRVSDLSSRVLQLRAEGTFLTAILTNAVLRLYRSGSRLSVDTIHNQHGASSKYGNVLVGNLLWIVSPVGILICDLTSGQLDVVGATQHFFDETGYWNSDLSSIEAAYDSSIGAVVFLNTVKAEMLLIWLNHGVLTHMIDCPWERLFTMTDLQTGGTKRVGLYISGQGVFEIDANRSQTYKTTCGNAAGSDLAWNGLAGVGTNSTTLVPPVGKNFSADMIGHYVRFFTSDGFPLGGTIRAFGYTGNRAKITGFSGGNLTFAAVSPAPVSGDRFCIAAIPVSLRAWPLFGDPNAPLLDMVRGKKTQAMAAVVADAVGDTAVVEAMKLRYQLFGRNPSAVDDTTPLLEVEGTLDEARNNPTYTGVRWGSEPVLVPGIEIWSSNLDLSLLGFLVQGTMEGSKQD
jgi:hypothetical protein